MNLNKRFFYDYTYVFGLKQIWNVCTNFTYVEAILDFVNYDLES